MAYRTLSVKEDCAGSVSWYGWIISKYHSKHWEVPGFKRGLNRQRTNWRGVIKKDLQRTGLTWEEAEVAALNRQEWRRNVARCVHSDAGWIKFNFNKKSWSPRTIVVTDLPYYSRLTWFCTCADRYVIFNTQPHTTLGDGWIDQGTTW